jgi:hypothetical protein
MGLLVLGLLEALFLEEPRVVSTDGEGEGEDEDSNLLKDFVDPTLGRGDSGVLVRAIVAEAIAYVWGGFVVVPVSVSGS